MPRATKKRLTWEATQGAARIVLIKEGRLVLQRKSRRKPEPSRSSTRKY